MALAVAAFVALIGATLYFSLGSHSNRDAAIRWRAHAEQTDKLLTTRTRQLNTRSTALNRTAAELASSERDVRTLESRQRRLANEKAQVEDQRGQMVVQTSQLTALADEQRACSSGLSQLLNEFANSDYEAVDADAAAVGGACQTAQDDFALFQARYGSG